MNGEIKKRLRGHLVRWLVIVGLLISYLWLFTAPIPWSMESLVQQQTRNMEYPEAEAWSVQSLDKGISSIVLYDQVNDIYHHLFAEKFAGLFWISRGGGYGQMFDPDYILRFRMGMSTFSEHRNYYYSDWIGDPAIKRMKIQWFDGVEQEVEIKGDIAHAARAIPEDYQSLTGRREYENLLFAYDEKGQLLYELSSNTGEGTYFIKKPEAVTP